jgi:hypothetical protein
MNDILALRKNAVLLLHICMSSPPSDHWETFTSSDGSEYQYTGLCQNGEPHGKGWKVWADGDSYKGTFRQGLREGRGFHKYANGAWYEGEWRSDKKDGEGKMVLPNGDSYEGTFCNDMRDGRGKNTFAADGRTSLPFCNYFMTSGDVYDGGFKANNRHGSCKYTFFNGETLPFTWADGVCAEFTAIQAVILSAAGSAECRAKINAKAGADRAANAPVAESILASCEAKAFSAAAFTSDSASETVDDCAAGAKVAAVSRPAAAELLVPFLLPSEAFLPLFLVWYSHACVARLLATCLTPMQVSRAGTLCSSSWVATPSESAAAATKRGTGRTPAPIPPMIPARPFPWRAAQSEL